MCVCVCVCVWSYAIEMRTTFKVLATQLQWHIRSLISIVKEIMSSTVNLCRVCYDGKSLHVNLVLLI